MGSKRNRRSRRLDPPSPEGDFSETQVETSNQDNDALIDVDFKFQGILDSFELRPQLAEPSHLSNEIQAWTEIFEQKNNDRIMKKDYGNERRDGE